MAKLRIAVIGGGIRGSMYAQVAQEHPDAELVGFAEPSAKRAAELGNRFGVPVEADAEQLLGALDGVDAVIVATPDHLHLEPGLAALNEGLHVLFEKPLATDVGQSDQLLAAARSGSKVAVGFENRWHPKFQTVRRLLNEQEQSFVAQRALLSDTDFVPREMLPWAAKSTPGWFLMPHSLDMAMWLSGAVPTEVFARGVRKVLADDGVDTYDRISATFRMSDESVVSLESGWVLPRTRPAVFQFRFDVETAEDHFEIEIDRSGITRFAQGSASYVGLVEEDLRGRLQGSPIDMTKDFIDWCLGAEVEMPTIQHGHQVTVAIDALHRSLADNENVIIAQLNG